MLEIWDGRQWKDITISSPDTFTNFVEEKGILHIKGYIYTILRRNRFRFTYRYGGDQEGEAIPRDIRRCAKLMTAIDILSTDFKMSQIAYGGEGNVDKQAIMDKWQKQVDKIIWAHSEIMTIF